jgi:hypothetical protein
MQSAKGTYALLLGSGISRSAQVLTGWEVVSELARRSAVAAEEDPGDEPIAWYAQRFGGDVDYSRILEDLAPTPAERRALLEGFFVPTDDERSRGIKTPTSAHRAIARLATGGYIRVIVTTNFDRLLETALSEVGVDAEVISSAAVAAGATPLNHARLTIIKVHGDYMSPDLKNTVDELAGYDPVVDALLDEIFDRYGLVVCGWSAEWDEALRAAVGRAPNRRYTTYWCHRSPPSALAGELVSNRGGQLVPIRDADHFFEDLETKVSLLANMALAPPLTTALAVEELKRYLPDPIARIRLSDLVDSEAARAAEGVGLEHFPTTHDPSLTRDDVVARLQRYDTQMERIASLMVTGVRFGDPAQHDDLWVRALMAIERRPKSTGGGRWWVDLQGYPTTVGVFAIGLAGIATSHIGALLHILTTRVSNPTTGGSETILERAIPLRGMGDQVPTVLAGGRVVTAASDQLYAALRDPTRQLFIEDQEYDHVFDVLELMMAVMFRSVTGYPYLGRFWRNHFTWGRAATTLPSLEPYRVELVASSAIGSDETFDEALNSVVTLGETTPRI